jgi:hypothetical protein
VDILGLIIGALKINSQTTPKEIAETSKVLNLLIAEHLKVT